MSYFVCGLISLAGADSEVREAEARRISCEALKTGMSVQLGANIVQPLVLKIVGWSGGPDTIPFLITASPLSDTSDELVSPYVLVGAPGTAKFRQNAKHIACFFDAVFAEAHVQRVDLYVVDDFDESIRTKTIPLANLELKLLEEWEKRNEDFFFHLVLCRLEIARRRD